MLGGPEELLNLQRDAVVHPLKITIIKKNKSGSGENTITFCLY